MNLTIVIPDAVAAKVIEAVAAQNGYTAATKPGKSGKKTPPTPTEFVQQKILDWLLASARSHIVNTAAEQARQAALRELVF